MKGSLPQTQSSDTLTSLRLLVVDDTMSLTPSCKHHYLVLKFLKGSTSFISLKAETLKYGEQTSTVQTPVSLLYVFVSVCHLSRSDSVNMLSVLLHLLCSVP